MEVEATARSNDPISFGLSVSFTSDELKGVLEDVVDPDEQLYFDVFSDAWKNLTSVERIKRVLLIAELVEEFLKAKSTNPTLTLEDKGITP